MANLGYVNLFSYDAGHLHIGPFIYPTFEIAEKVARHKLNYICTTTVKVPDQLFELNLNRNGWIKKTNG